MPKKWKIALAVTVVVVLSAGAAYASYASRSPGTAAPAASAGVTSGAASSGPSAGATAAPTVSSPPASSTPESSASGASTPAAIPARFVAGVSPDGRRFVGTDGQPLFVQGDAPWSLLVDLSADQVRTYFAGRQAQGFNAAIVSLVGAVSNGGPSDDGATYDGVPPFVGGDVTRWNDAYWERARSYVQTAAQYGFTVFLYPIDGWTIEGAFKQATVAQCRTYGSQVGRWFANDPNIVWVVGGDYVPGGEDASTTHSGWDLCYQAMHEGLQQAGDSRPFSIQLFGPWSVSTDDPYWAPRVDWNFVYTYEPTYYAVLHAYAARPAVPAVLGEANYEGENNYPDTPGTTKETLRRQVLWAVTSGAAGDFFGTSDWGLPDGWEGRLHSAGATEVGALAQLVSSLSWWSQLVPDTARPLVVAGRGDEAFPDDESSDVLDSDYVTAAVTTDRSDALVYVPTARTIGIDPATLAGPATATWVDPSSGRRVPGGTGPSFTTPGPNADGDGDWLLLLTAD